MIFLVKSPIKKEENIPFKVFAKNTKKIFKENGRWLVAVFIIGGILMFVLFGVLFYLSDVLEKVYHIKGIKKGLLLAVPLGALCLSSFIAGKKIKENKILMKWITFSGIVILTASIAGLSFSNSLWYMISTFVLSGIGIGVGLPCLDSLITEGIEEKERGTITALYSSMRFIGVAAGPPVVAIVLSHSDKWLFIILCSFGILAGLASLFAIKPNKGETK
jgi:ACDE family multidrug resistance protein